MTLSPSSSAREMDPIDQAIVAALTANARRTLSEIAAQVNLSAPAVKRRIDRLEEAGVIAGYTIRVDQSKLGRPLEAFIELRFTGATSVDEITGLTTDLPEVESVFTMAGDPDALIRLQVGNVEHLKRVIDRIRKSGKVTDTKTLMVLGAWSRNQV